MRCLFCNFSLKKIKNVDHYELYCNRCNCKPIRFFFLIKSCSIEFWHAYIKMTADCTLHFYDSHYSQHFDKIIACSLITPNSCLNSNFEFKYNLKYLEEITKLLLTFQ